MAWNDSNTARKSALRSLGMAVAVEGHPITEERIQRKPYGP